MDAVRPWTPFFKRLEAMATAAFLTIPFAGPGLADFFNRVFLPFWSPKRDVILAAFAWLFGGVGRGLGAALNRLLPGNRGKLKA
jgi:hypothetical protein